jgi:deferrochelatase/peroxidase EfeB
MVIGTAAALLGGAAILGGVVSAKSSSSAANKATAASQAATNSNNILARETRDINNATLAPFVQQGGAATSYINQLLGIKTAPAAYQPSGYPDGTYNPGTTGPRLANDLSWNGTGRDPNAGYYETMGGAQGTVPS